MIPDSEKDDFWDIQALVPGRPRSSPAPASRTEPVEIEVPAAPGRPAAADRPAAGPEPEARIPREAGVPATAGARGTAAPCAPEAEYEPENSLIHKVRIRAWHTNYSYYESFCRTAMQLYGKTAPKTEHVPFFSYMPQYSQMNGQQLSFYLWMRSEIRAGRYPEADYSYVLLLIYEIINLSDRTDPHESCDLLVSIWLAYRSSYQRLDVQLSDWICDFCLINRIRPPFDRLEQLGDQLIRGASLKEFYVDIGSGSDLYAALLMQYCSNYDFRKSKFAVGENLALYRQHMVGVLSYVIRHTEDTAHPLSAGLQDSRATRDAYTGALCSPRIKKRIELEYCSFSHSHELRFLVTDLLKYAENRLRAHLGIKSRLSHGTLPEEVRTAAERYFAQALPARRVQKPASPELPEYEKLYEPARTPLSPERAREIELVSWQTTEKLIEAFADAEEPLPGSDAIPEEQTGAPAGVPAEVPVEIPAEEQPEAPVYPTEARGAAPVSPASGDPFAALFADPGEAGGEAAEGDWLAALTDDEREFLTAALSGDGGALRSIARRTGRMTDAMADTINEKAADLFGDVVLEDDGNGYRIPEEYAEEIAASLSARKDGGETGTARTDGEEV